MRQQLVDLRAVMDKHGVDYCLVPSNDFHGSEDLSDHFKARKWVSGFTGSAGTLLVGKDWASLWTDGRYFLQAADQLAGSGIELGDPVVTEYGAVVGQITELGENWATVSTLIDVDMSVGGYVGSTGSSGMVVGEFSLMKNKTAKLTFLADGAQIFVGEEVLTSGSGGAFPAGLVIGTITNVQTEAGGQIEYGIIKPQCDLDSLVQVFVIKSFTAVE